MYGSVIEDKSALRMLGLTLSFIFDWGSYIISIAKSTCKKIGPSIYLMKFLSPEVAYFSINLSCSHAWNTVVMSGLQAFFQVLFYYW